MITFLLTILKIIGVILLVLLGLILLVLCLVLFAPVKYRAKGAKHPEEMYVSAFISYLRPLVRVRVSYPGDPVLSVKVLWFDLLKPREEKKDSRGRPAKKKAKKKPSAKKTDQKQRNEKKASAEKKSASASAEMSANTKSKIVYSTETFRGEDEAVSREKAEKSASQEKAEKEKSASQEKAAKEKATSHEKEAKDTAASQETDEKEKATYHEKAEKEKAASPRDTKEKSSSGESKNKRPADDFDDSDDKAENRLVKIAAFLWQYKEMYPDVLGKVFRALKTVLPRKCNIHLIFGTGSPETTGYLYGAYCALGEYLPGTVEFEPVWMESYLDVDFELSGKIRVIHFVTAAVKIIADKRVRHFISEIRRI
ncbi:MAG: hypothetical protein LUC90_04690 [Lachnospiraceae bacterium]|nr:hypothetical protein [Lachnospiraceae bacterium]